MAELTRNEHRAGVLALIIIILAIVCFVLFIILIGVIIWRIRSENKARRAKELRRARQDATMSGGLG